MEEPIICRACLSEITNQYISLDATLYNTTVLDVFNYCTKLEVSLEDDLPTNMCIPCGNSLQTAYDFIKTANETDQILRENIVRESEKEDKLEVDGEVVIQDINKIECDSDKEYIEEYVEDNIDDNIEIKKEDEELKLEVPSPKEEIDIELIDEKGKDSFQSYFESITKSEVPDEYTELKELEIINEAVNECGRSEHSDIHDEFMEEIEATNCKKSKKTEVSKKRKINKAIHLYKCDTCEKLFKNMFSRNKHEFLEHKNSEQIQCKLCPFMTSSHSSWQTHRYRHENPTPKKYLCSFCSKVFTNPKSLIVHEDYQHGNKEWAVKCEKCNKKFMNKQKLEYHILSAHSNGRNYQCPECPKTFKNSFQLRAHQKLHTDRTIDCPECEKKFVRQVDLKIHMRIHTGELPYKCHLCDKSYRIKVRLTYHLQKHLGTKHVCDFCSSEFNSKSKLRLHMFEHIGMPYVCDLCEMGFKHRGGLSRHSKAAHHISMTDEELLQNRLKNEKNIKRGFVSADALIDNSYVELEV